MLLVRIWRLLLSFLLVVVLPIQGYAATRMLACDLQMPAAQTTGVEQIPMHAQMNDAMPAAMHEHHHGDGSMSMQHASASTVMDDMSSMHGAQAGDAAHHAPAHGKCTGCAPCCMGAALTAAVLIHDRLPAAHAGFAAPASAHASAYVGLPDRPPQPVLA